jgi:hypothetical protein
MLHKKDEKIEKKSLLVFFKRSMRFSLPGFRWKTPIAGCIRRMDRQGPTPRQQNIILSKDGFPMCRD